MGSSSDIKKMLENVLNEVDGLKGEVKQLRCENEQLREQNQELRERVTELEDELVEAKRASKRQAAPFRRNKKIPKEKHKKAGRKKGHKPSFREPPKDVDRTVEVKLEGSCPDCGSTLEEKRFHEHYVVDIPQIIPTTIKYVTESGKCPCCEQRWNSAHPGLPSFATGAAGVMVGPGAVSLAAQMRAEFGAPLRKISKFLSTALNLKISASGVLGLLKRAAESLKTSCDSIADSLRSSERVCVDETSWRLCSDGAWC